MANHPLLSQFGCGYGVLNAADYGVPQTRRRGIFMAVYKQSVPWPPPPTHGDSPMFEQPYRTVRDVISDLPAEPTTDQPTTADDGSQDLHIRRNPRENLSAALPGYPTGREPLRSAAQSARHHAGLLAQQAHGHY